MFTIAALYQFTDFPDPVAATLALVRAEAQRLIHEVSPGRYVASDNVGP